jgi:ABC-2 type transport system permease protein
MRRGFILLVFAPPVLMVALVAIIVAYEESQLSREPIGFVDQAGNLDPALQSSLADADGLIPLREYASVDEGLTALENRSIQALFVMPADFPNSLETTVYYREAPPSGEAWGEFDDFVRLNLLQEYPANVQARLQAGPTITVEDIESGRTFSEDSMINIILPFIAAFLFFLVTMGVSSYMLQVVADEKENRTMEILLTTLSPGELIGGKMAGLLAMGLLQLLIYVVTMAIVLLILMSRVPVLRALDLSGEFVVIIALFFFPTMILIQAVMVAVGSIAPDMEQGQQFAGLLNLVFLAPLMLVPLLMINPDSLLFRFMTYFPTTSFLTISMRWGLGSLPYWQMALSWVILVGTTLFAIWAAGRVFQIGMLRYGQQLSWRSVVGAIRSEQPA